MKRAFTALAFVLLSTAALALPSPKEIETAVNAGQYSQAEVMLREVIREKPGSAKAHYELGQVLVRKSQNQEARRELLEAQRLDPSLKFARDPKHFHDLLDKIPAASLKAPAPLAQEPRSPASMPMQDQATPWSTSTYLMIGAAAFALIFLAFRVFAKRAPAGFAPAGMASAGVATAGGRFGAGAPVSGPGAPGSGYAGPAPAYGNPPQSGGMGMGGAVLGGVAGLAAGYGLAKAFEHGNDAPRTHAASDSGYVPIDSAPAAPVDAGEFDAGTGDSWDAGDSGGSGGDSGSSDDSW